MTKTTKTVYVTSDAEEFYSESDAQAHELNLLNGYTGTDHDYGRWTLANKNDILSILGAKRKARSDKGKSRKAKDLHPFETAAILKGKA